MLFCFVFCCFFIFGIFCLFVIIYILFFWFFSFFIKTEKKGLFPHTWEKLIVIYLPLSF